MADKKLGDLPAVATFQDADLIYAVQAGADKRATIEKLAEGVRGVPIPYVEFETSPTPPAHAEGRIFWSEDDHTINLMPDIDGVILQVGQENWVRAINDTGSPIDNGQVVYVSGASAGRPEITEASASSIAESEAVLGITTHAIGDGEEGFVTTFGLVRDLDTAGMGAGSVIYLDTVAGDFTDTAPAPPNQTVRVGVVLVDDATDGVILFQHFQTPGADYAGMRFDDNAVETEIEWAEIYHLVGLFDVNGPYSTSVPDQASNRITIGQTRDYDISLDVHAESAGLSKSYEFRLFVIASSTTAITGITQANPGVVSAAGHGRSNGDQVKITGVGGMTELNDKIFVVAGATAGTFELNDEDSNPINTGGLGAYTAGGTVAEATDTAVHTKHEYKQTADAVSAGPYPSRLTAGNYLEAYVEGYTDATNITIDGALASLRVLSQS